MKLCYKNGMTGTYKQIRTKAKPADQMEKPIKRIEAQWVASWLEGIGKPVPGGWTGVWQMTASQVAEDYDALISDVLAAMRGEKRKAKGDDG